MAGKPKGEHVLNVAFTIPMSRGVIDRLEMEAAKTGETKTALARGMILAGLGMREKVDG